MYNKCLIIILVIGNVYFSNGQSTVDSLRKSLETSAYDTARVETLLDISFQYRNSNPDSTIYFAQQSLELSKELKYPRGHAQSLRNIGLGYLRLGKPDTTINLCQQALSIAKEANNQWAMANAYNTLGVALFYKTEYDKSIEAFEQSAKAFEALGQPVDVAGALMNTGSILEEKGDYARALDYYQQALQVFEKENHTYGIATVSYNMANIFDGLGDLKKALEFYEKTLHYDSINNDISGIAGSQSSIGSTHLALGDTAKAFSYYYKAVDTYGKAQAECNSINTLSNLGDLYLETLQMDSAYYYLKRAVDIAEACDHDNDLIDALTNYGKYLYVTGQYKDARQTLHRSYDMSAREELKPGMASAAEYLYLTYKAENNIARALYYLEQNKKLEDELFNKENTRKITQLEGAYALEKEKQAFEYEKKLNEMKFQEQINKEKDIQHIILITLIVFAGLVIVILILYLQKRKVNKEVLEQYNQIMEQNEEIRQQHDLLEERSRVVEQQKHDLLKSNEELHELNDEKNTIIGIVAHDLKSPLNQIKGLLALINMESDQVSDNTKDYLDKLTNASEHAIHMIDRMLDINAIENKTIDAEIEDVDLISLVDELTKNFNPEATEKNINIKKDMQLQEAHIKTDKLLLREIMENLLSNALKFSPQGSQITIGLSSNNNERLHLSVIDQGPGISKEDQAKMYNMYQRTTASPTGKEKSTGLGLAIVKRYAAVLGYHITCNSQPGKGSTFIVEM